MIEHCKDIAQTRSIGGGLFNFSDMKKPNITEGEWIFTNGLSIRQNSGAMKHIAECGEVKMNPDKENIRKSNAELISASKDLLNSLFDIMSDEELIISMGSVKRINAIKALRKAGCK